MILFLAALVPVLLCSNPQDEAKAWHAISDEMGNPQDTWWYQRVIIDQPPLHHEEINPTYDLAETIYSEELREDREQSTFLDECDVYQYLFSCDLGSPEWRQELARLGEAFPPAGGLYEAYVCVRRWLAGRDTQVPSLPVYRAVERMRWLQSRFAFTWQMSEFRKELETHIAHAVACDEYQEQKAIYQAWLKS